MKLTHPWPAALPRSVALLLAGLVLGYIGGLGAAPSASVRADVTQDAKREAFRSGAVLNEPVLREIAATLKRIESRVETIEKNTGMKNQGPVAPSRK